MGNSTHCLTINASGSPAKLAVLLYFPECKDFDSVACNRASQAAATMVSLHWKCVVSICRSGIEQTWCVPMRITTCADIDVAVDYMRSWLRDEFVKKANPFFNVDSNRFHSGKAAKYFIEDRLAAIERIHKS